jgi:two-component system OmpR family response regulator
VGESLAVNGWVLDEETQSVSRNAQRWQLTGIEFRLLRYFMLHPGHILSKSRLTEHVYEQDADKDSNVIEVYVNRLRQKLGNDIIATRRGQGYIFGESA